MPPANKSLRRHIPDFLDHLEVERGLSEITQINYSRYLKKFTDWLRLVGKEDLTPPLLTAEDIWSYRLFLAKRSGPDQKLLKRTTQNYYLIALRGLLGYFIDKDIPCIPPDKIKLAKDDKSGQKIKFLTLDQIEKLLLAPDVQTIIGLRDRAILETLFSTGLRVSELVKLNQDRIPIKKQLSNLETTVVGKGNRVRTVYFSSRALVWLQKYIKLRNDDDKALFISHSFNTSKQANRLTSRSMELIVQKYARLAGIPVDASPHTLRHSYATDLLIHGVDLRLVQEFLGHKNIATTQIYTHVTNKQLKDVHSKFHGGNDIRNE